MYPRYKPKWPRGVRGSEISWHSAHESGKVVTPTHRPPLPPRISWYSFLEAESTPDTWMLRKKSPVTRPGIDPGTFRLVAQRLMNIFENIFFLYGQYSLILWEQNTNYTMHGIVFLQITNNCSASREITIFYITTNFITVYSRNRLWSLSWIRWIKTELPQHFPNEHFNIMLLYTWPSPK